MPALRKEGDLGMNEKVIWDFLISKTGNAKGTAAIMGNLMAESSLNPRCVTGTKDLDYVQKADAGELDFVHDKHAFGLVQWCYYSRKEGLMNHAKATGRSVGHLQMQLEYLVKEMSGSYKTAWAAACNAKDIREASDVIMLKYEKPAGTGEAAKKKRAEYGQKFYDQFAGARMVVATANVRIRAGDSTTYSQVGSLKKGQSLEFVTVSNGFYGVRMTDRIGWVSGEFAEVRG